MQQCRDQLSRVRVGPCERFRLYLLVKHFTIYTDCATISIMKKTTSMIPQVSRWLLKLLEYRPGELMAHVDAISRAPVEQINK